MDETRFESAFTPKQHLLSPPPPAPKSPKFLYALFLYVVIFSNFDTGVIPAALKPMTHALQLSELEEAAIGSLPFFGVSFGSLAVAIAMKRFSAKKTLLAALFANILCSVWFASSTSLLQMYLSRFLMGFTQAFWVVYGPVWTNHHSPRGSQTTWLGIMQGFSPIGIIIGYIVTGLLVTNWDSWFNWRMGVLIQGIGELPVLLIFGFLVPNADVEMRDGDEEDSSPALYDAKSGSFRALFRNFTYILAVCTNCVAFFVVFGLQFWGTLYIIDILNEDSRTAMWTYAFITLTAPFFGVFLGGWISDRCGGYKGKRVVTALKLCMWFSLTATIIGLMLGFVFTLQAWAPMVWLQIFFGACLIPPGAGVVVNSVEKSLQTTASGMAQLVYNVLGYFLSPLFSAFIMERFEDRLEGMVWGYFLFLN